MSTSLRQFSPKVHLHIRPRELWWRGAKRKPRAWQKEALPHILEAIGEQRRSLVSAVTGAGKSALLAEVCAQVLPSATGRVVVSTSTVQLVHQLSSTIQARLGVEVGQRYAEARTDGRVIVTSNASMLALLEEMQERGHQVELWLVDEAHGSQCSTMLEVGDWLEEVPRVGFTATPYRARNGERLELFEHLAYRYRLDRALAEGVVVPPQVELWRGQVTDLDDACMSMIRGSLKLGPGVVNAISIDDAEQFAWVLREAGIPSEAVHSQLEPGELGEAIEALRMGQLRCLVHVSLLSEGVDLPWLRWLCLRRQVGSRVRFAQEIGRGLRSFPGKKHLLVLDPLGITGQLSLSYEAMLGAGQEEEPEDGGAVSLLNNRLSHQGQSTPVIAEFARGSGVAASAAAEPLLARPTDDLLASLRSLRLYLETKGVCEPRHPTRPEVMHRQLQEAIKAEQLANLERLSQRLSKVPLPERARRLFGWVLHHRQRLNCAAATDAEVVMRGLIARGWRY